MWSEEAPLLQGSHVRLEPLSDVHAEGLHRAALDRSTFHYTGVPSTLEGQLEYVQTMTRLRSEGQACAFAQVQQSTGQVVGTTRFMTPRETDTQLYAIEIGGTWLSPSVQGTPINREAKLLLATYAFEELGVARLDCKTDARNERARRAIASFGASFEGILHNWQPSLVAGEESKYRDTAMYAITAEAWPTVRQELERRLYS